MWPFSRESKRAAARLDQQSKVHATRTREVPRQPAPADSRLTLPPAPAAIPDIDEAVSFTSVTETRIALPTNGHVAVVGESHYQRALRLAARGASAGDDFDHHLPVTVLLVPEPENPWDSNAIRVDVVIVDQTVKVGYLARAMASEYQPELLKLRNDGAVATCPGRITGGGTKFYGIYLHLCYPEDLRISNGTEDPEIAEEDDKKAVFRSEWPCTVTKEKAYQDALSWYEPQAGTQYRPAMAELGFCKITSGKYRSETAIEVRLENRRVGELTYAMTVRYSAMVSRILASGRIPTCNSFITRTKNGLEIELLMPRVSNADSST